MIAVFHWHKKLKVCLHFEENFSTNPLYFTNSNPYQRSAQTLSHWIPPSTWRSSPVLGSPEVAPRHWLLESQLSWVISCFPWRKRWRKRLGRRWERHYASARFACARAKMVSRFFSSTSFNVPIFLTCCSCCSCLYLIQYRDQLRATRHKSKWHRVSGIIDMQG